MKPFSTRSNCVRAARKALEDPEARAGVHFAISETNGEFSYALITKKIDDGVPAALIVPQEPPNSPQRLTGVEAEINRLIKARNGGFNAAKPTPKPDKTSTLMSMLKGNGSSVEAITKATGWQPHTLRARLSGLAKPPLSLKIVRERRDDVTSYRLA